MVDLMDVTPAPETPAPAPETSWVNGSGDFGEGVPDKIKELLDKKKWTNVSQIADGYMDLEKFKGAGEHLVIPESAEDVEGWDKVWSAIGKPDSADKYEFNNESGIELSDDLMNGFKEFAHSANYTQDQLAGAIKFQLDAIKAGDDLFLAQKEEHETENINAMKQKWQDEYEPTVTKIDSTLEKLGVKEYFKSLGIDKEPQVVNMALTVANSDAEDTLDVIGGKIPATETLQDKLQKILKSDAFKERFHKDHKKVHAEFMELNMQIANAGQGRAPQ